MMLRSESYRVLAEQRAQSAEERALIIEEQAREEQARVAGFDGATMDHLWVNSLGMQFVRVAHTQVLFSIWDTRVQDFEKFIKSKGFDATGGMLSVSKNGWNAQGATWNEPGFEQGSTNPVVGVNRNDANEFRKFLTELERSAGNISKNMKYRLPTDEEWSIAVGLPSEHGDSPSEKDSGIKLYPWGPLWPPANVGNYAGEEAKTDDWPSVWGAIKGYNDGYPRTSPVACFKANQFGLYDMGGNVWQWCSDSYDGQDPSIGLIRGASWWNSEANQLLASYRGQSNRLSRYANIGFRCVLAVESSP
jgi:formylglycine-generating enzyme required for sulfatase activity